MQDHTKIWLIATMISLSLGVVSEMVKLVVLSTLFKIMERFSDAGAEILLVIAGELASRDTKIS
eukprot:COSAG02_NODE_4149_length_5710_cov_6.668330_5_plen_64_part_00